MRWPHFLRRLAISIQLLDIRVHKQKGRQYFNPEWDIKFEEMDLFPESTQVNQVRDDRKSYLSSDSSKEKMTIYTIGHSNRRWETFVKLLKDNRIEMVIDVRAFPSSRKFRHFNKRNLKVFLYKEGIDYIWMGKELGGYRKKTEGLGNKSPNKGWDASGFRIYADYMLSERFEKAINKLEDLAKEKNLALMCSERLYWKCHRQLISDFLVKQGQEVWHIVDENELRKHELTRLARIEKGVLIYPEADDELRLPFPE
ncbi:MAG: DUF488 family protein [Candidatus Aminicenantaceae bacterium]